MFLTPVNGTDADLRFTIKAGGVEQQINTSSKVPTRGWAHLAVTWTNDVGILYLNGVEVGRNSEMTLNPSSLGATTQNYIGKSQYADPYLLGKVDDFRIYNRALSPAEIGELTYVPQKLGDYDFDGTVGGRDFLVWQRQFRQPTSVYQQADGDGSGVVDPADLAVWSNYYGLAAPLTADDDELAQEVAALNADAATDAALAALTVSDFDGGELSGLWLPKYESAEPLKTARVIVDSSAVEFEERLEGDLNSDPMSDTFVSQDEAEPLKLRELDSEREPVEIEDWLVSAALLGDDGNL